MKPVDIALALLVMAVWASNIVAARIGAAAIPGWELIALRMCVIAITLVPFVRPPIGHMRKIFALSVTMGTLHFGMMFVALERIHAGTGALIIQLSVPFAALLAWIVFGERLGWARAVGIVTAFAGVVLVVGAPHASDNLPQVALAIFSALAFAVANLQLRGLGGVSVFAINGWMAIFAIPQMVVLSLIFEHGQLDAIRNIDTGTIIDILYMGVVVSIVGHGLWYLLVPKYQTNQTMPFTLLIPVFGVSFGALILGEPVNWQVLAGGLVTIGGVAAIIFRRPAAAPVVPAAAIAEPAPERAGD